MNRQVKVTLRRNALGDAYIVEKLIGATNVNDCFAGDLISEKGVNSLIANRRDYEVTILAPKY
jgi:hypothetical protein